VHERHDWQARHERQLKVSVEEAVRCSIGWVSSHGAASLPTFVSLCALNCPYAFRPTTAHHRRLPPFTTMPWACLHACNGKRPYRPPAHSPVSRWYMAWLPRRLAALPSRATNELLAGLSSAPEPAVEAGPAAEAAAAVACRSPPLAAPFREYREFWRVFQSAVRCITSNGEFGGCWGLGASEHGRASAG